MGKEYTRALTTLGLLPVAGQVILHDDFEGLLKWTKADGVGDSIFELDTNISKHGSQSLHLKTRTTDTAGGDEISAYLRTHLLPSKIITAICSFRLPSITTPAHLQFSLIFDDASVLYEARASFRPNTPDWQYLTTGTSLASIANSGLDLSTNAWHQIILKANFATKKYISLAVDHLLFDLSSFIIDEQVSNSEINFVPKIILETAGAAPTEGYFDDFIYHEL